MGDEGPDHLIDQVLGGRRISVFFYKGSFKGSPEVSFFFLGGGGGALGFRVLLWGVGFRVSGFRGLGV